MNFDFLPKKLFEDIMSLDLDKIYEIRLRINSPITVFYIDKYIKIEKHICTNNEIDKLLEKVTEHSIYAYNNQILNGFLTLNNGVRIGLAGKIVTNDGQAKTIVDITSINIRIPHLIKDCSLFIFNIINFIDTPKNILIFSSPFMGKTTILKDFALQICEKTNLQILIIDERGEFASVQGDNIDKISFCTKEYGFNIGIRAMSPQIIITDEIIDKDLFFLENALNSGIHIIASCHANSINEIKEKLADFNFDYYVGLRNSKCKGQVDSIYNKKMEKIK